MADAKGATTDVNNPLRECRCDGQDYKGMPKVSFGLGINGYLTHYSYTMTAD